MDIEKYKKSGILEEYCLGLTSEKECEEVEALSAIHIELREELEEIQKTLNQYAKSHAQLPNRQLKNRILYAIDELDFVETPSFETLPPIDLQNPPLLHKKSDYLQWKKAVEDLQPTEIVENLPVHPLRVNEDVQLFVVWADEKVVNESHEMESESFLILEGTCTCFVGNAVHHLKAGDFLGIPTYTDHSLKVTSNQAVKFIVQRVRLVA